MTDKIVSEIEEFFKENQKETEQYIDAFKRLDMDSQFQIIDAITYLVEEQGLETREATIQVFNNILQQMGQKNVFRIII